MHAEWLIILLDFASLGYPQYKIFTQTNWMDEFSEILDSDFYQLLECYRTVYFERKD